MDIVELQSVFDKAVMFYLKDDIKGLYESEYVKNDNPDIKSNYLISITKWRHAKPQPTNEQLMKYSVQEVNDYWDDNVNAQQDIENIKFLSLSSTQRGKLKNVRDGTIFYNKTKKQLEVFINGTWKAIATV